MPDLLVRLYDLPPLSPALTKAAERGIEIRRAVAPEKPLVVDWVRAAFSIAWAAECDVAFSRQPVACFIATRGGEICGFGAYEATCRNFFGPLGVGSECRRQGAGEALLLCGLHAMQNEGYAYAIIGGAGPVEFFSRTVHATEIPDSTPGIYRGLLRPSGNRP